MNREPVVEYRENVMMVIPSDCCAHFPRRNSWGRGGRVLANAVDGV